MFFVLSKILNFALSPIVWIIFVLIISLLSKNRKTKKRLLIAGLIMSVFFSNSIIFRFFSNIVSTEPVSYESLSNQYDYGIVLGGLASYDDSFKRVNFHEANDRLMQAVDLYDKGKIKKILISGGSGNLFYEEKKEADILKKILINMSIPDSDIVIENKSKNTYENAFFTAKILKNKQYNNLLLITSALHISRAKKCFKKQGVIVDVFPADYHLYPFTVDNILFPKPEILSEWAKLFHEIIGTVAYKFAGYI